MSNESENFHLDGILQFLVEGVAGLKGGIEVVVHPVMLLGVWRGLACLLSTRGARAVSGNC